MKDVGELLKGLAAILWPLAVIGVLYSFRGLIKALIESARSRKFSLKIAGQELSMEEANQQQATFIADLQSRVAELGKAIESLGTAPAFEPPPKPRSHQAVLWVDDNPKNNSYFVQQLRDHGNEVDLALSSDQALELIARKSYDAIISDMGRREDSGYNPDAGLDLLRSLNGSGSATPVIFFCSTKAAAEFRQQALTLRAKGITSSGTELVGLLDGVGVRFGA